MKTKMKLKKTIRNTYTEAGIIGVRAYDLLEPIEGLRLFAHPRGERQWLISEFTTGFCVSSTFTENKFIAIDDCKQRLARFKDQLSVALANAQRQVGEAFPVNEE